MHTEFKTRRLCRKKFQTDHTNGRRGIVLDCNVNTGQSKVYWHKQTYSPLVFMVFALVT